MPDLPAQIGPYSIERELGRGGMGVVYLGRDPRLERNVAIKSLAGDLASEPGLMARFDREARLLASLNHPNIAGVYGLEDVGGTRFLVMEFVEGRTLAERLRDGPLPMDETLAVVAGVAAGVEAAHEAGVIHRDLKPGNVIISPAGIPKVLDFGLAKASFEEQASGRKIGAASSAASAARGTAALSHDSPTLPVGAGGPSRSDPESPTQSISTKPGRVLGTAGYMSPEQARGRMVDRRTDVWSLGCILFECLTGKSPFAAPTVSDSIASIIERDPAWATLPANTPPRIRELLIRCLEKDATKRMRDAGDVRLEIERALSGREWSASFIASHSAIAMPAPSGRRFGLGWITAALLVGAALAAGAFMLRSGAITAQESDRPVMRLAVPMPAGIVGGGVGATADEKALVFSGRELRGGMPRDETARLYLRRFEELEAKPIPGTERAGSWSLSPDGRWLAYVQGGSQDATSSRIFKQPLDGSTPPTMVAQQTGDTPFGSIVWLEGGRIVALQQGAKRIAQIFSADTGALLRETPLKVGDELMEFNRPSRLPGSDHLLADWWRYTDRAYTCSAAVIDLTSGTVTSVQENAQSPRYSSTGHLVFTREDVILAARFDVATGTVIGPAFSVGTGVLAEGGVWAAGSFSLTPGGTLVHLPGGVTGTKRRVMVVQPGKEATPLVDDPRPLETGLVAITPAGDRAAVTIANRNALFEVWMWEQGNGRFQRIIAEPGADFGASFWSDDGATLYLGRQGGGDGRDGIYTFDPATQQAPKLLAKTPQQYKFMVASNVSADGRWLVGFTWDGERSGLFVLDLKTQSPTPRFIPPGDRFLASPTLSPDASLVCYLVQNPQGAELEIARFNSEGDISEKVPVATSVVTSRGIATWREAQTPAAGELLYISEDGTATAIEVFKEPRLRVGTPRKIATLERSWRASGVFPLKDGGLVFIQSGEDETPPTTYAVTLNFDLEILAKERAAGTGSTSSPSAP